MRVMRNPAPLPGPGTIALIQGAATLGGAAIGARSNNKATEAQRRTAEQALAFEREQEMQRRKEYEEQQARLKAEWDAYQERRRPYREAAEKLIRGAGYTPQQRPTSMPVGWTPPGTSPGGSSMSAPPAPSPTMASGGSGVPPLVPPRFKTNWSDWDNYLA